MEVTTRKLRGSIRISRSRVSQSGHSRPYQERRLLGILSGFLFLFLIRLAGIAAAAEDVNPLQPADTSSPRATLITFIDNITTAYMILEAAEFANMTEPGLFMTDAVRNRVEQARDHLSRAIRTLNLSEVPPTSVAHDVGLEKALLLKAVLDRVDLPPVSAIPDAQTVKQEDLMQWRVPNTNIVIAKVNDGHHAGEFLFSVGTVAQVDAFYARVKNRPYRSTATKDFYESYTTTPGNLLPPKWLHWLGNLPPWARTPIGGPTLWQWVALFVDVLLGILIPWLFYRWQSRREPPESLVWRAWRRLLVPAVIMLSMFLIGTIADQVINLTGNVYNFLLIVLAASYYLAAAWLTVVVGGGIVELIISSPRIDPNSLDANMLRVLFRVSSSVLALIVIFFGAERLGVPLLPLLAGLGVGGLALALAAQPTIENLIGGIMLYSDRPVGVGDLCQFGDLRGRVETIGLRSTRLRSIDRKVITVPNAEFAKMNLINYTQRDRMLIRTSIGLRYETTPEQLRYVLVKLREMLITHPRINLAPMRVRFIGFGAYSLDIQIHCFANTRLFPEMAAIREDVYLRAIDIIKEAGTDFAFPSQTTYLARDGGLDDERGRTAEQQVTAWRQEDELPFPDFDADRKQKIKDTLDYPPKGSPGAKPLESDKSARP